MSNASVTSSKREKLTAELLLELESIKAMNSSLHAYLQHLKLFKKNLSCMNENCKELSQVNAQWVNTLSAMKR